MQYPPSSDGVMSNSHDLAPALMPASNPTNMPADSPTTIVNPTSGKNINRSDAELEPVDIKLPILHVDSPRSSLEREKVEIKHRALEPVMEGPKVSLRTLFFNILG